MTAIAVAVGIIWLILRLSILKRQRPRGEPIIIRIELIVRQDRPPDRGSTPEPPAPRGGWVDRELDRIVREHKIQYPRTIKIGGGQS